MLLTLRPASCFRRHIIADESRITPRVACALFVCSFVIVIIFKLENYKFTTSPIHFFNAVNADGGLFVYPVLLVVNF